MAAIYEPSGAAREYSPLAMNYIHGCDHGCVYCVHPDTLVLLENGTNKPIKDLQVGENIVGVKKHDVDRSWGNRYTITQVLNKIKTVKSAYKIRLENGNDLICSGDHRWLTDRGWKYTIAKNNRPFLTANNLIRGIGNAIETPSITDNYKKGYLSGVITGDATMKVYDYSGKYQRRIKKAPQKTDIQHSFRLALKDEECLFRVKDYLTDFDIETNVFDFDNGDRGTLKAIRTNSKEKYHLIKNVIQQQEESEFYRGWLAGIFDAEGSFSTTIRIANNNESVLSFTKDAFSCFGFDTIIEERIDYCSMIRLRGGIVDISKFFQLTNPAITRKFVINGFAVNNNIKIASIEPLNEVIEMYDITTGTQNFIANGLISHNCYVPKMMKRFDKNYVHSDVYIKEETALLKEIERSCKKHEDSPKQVFLSFLTDPYSSFNEKTKLTRRVLEMLLKHRIPVSILSKGGLRILDDLDVIKEFGANIQVGASLTFTSLEDSLKWEKNAATPEERFEALRVIHENGIRTWASMEPVIYPAQSLEIMEITKDYVDAYKIGKLNHFPKHEQKFDWTKFLNDSIRVMRKNNKPFYIKNDLAEWSNEETILSKEERDMDFLAIPNKFEFKLTA